MQSNFVDTNIFIEVFARSGDKSDRSRKLLESSNNLTTSSLVFSEVEWVLRTGYERKKELVVRCLKKILTLDIEIDNKKLLMNTLNFYEMNNVDWTDCLNMFLVKENKISKVYSYDEGLNKFDWIKRLEP
ncbi:MAG: PIN domain-containing protein [bacterium]